MFNNVGSKIKSFSMIVSILGIFCCVIIGIINMVNELFDSGILIMIVGSILCWISSLVLYGFGELVENVSLITHIMIPNNSGGDYYLNNKIDKNMSSIIRVNKKYIYLSYWILAIITIVVSGIVAIIALTMK